MSREPAVAEAEDLAEKPYDANDPVAVNKRRKRTGRSRRTRLEFVAAMMSRPEGRAWAYDQLAQAHMFHTSFVPDNPHKTSFNEGERNAGLRLLADIEAAAPGEYMTMMREAKGTAYA